MIARVSVAALDSRRHPVSFVSAVYLEGSGDIAWYNTGDYTYNKFGELTQSREEFGRPSLDRPSGLTETITYSYVSRGEISGRAE